jgi:ABC-type branched-subunit amino acid transport system ATPase component
MVAQTQYNELPKRANMTLYDYWQASGKNARERKANLIKFCNDCGTKFEYIKHIANGRKRPGVDLARAMVRESAGALTLDELLPAKRKI